MDIKHAAEINEVKKKTRLSLGKKPVNHLRTTTLSMCSLFSLSRAEAADLACCIEAVDSSFTKQVNIYQFCELFCPKWKHCFKFLFSQYESLPVFQAAGHKSQNVSTKAKANQPASYFNVLGFLFLLVPLEQRDVIVFLFLLCYEHLRTRPNSEHITDTAMQLWGDASGGRKAMTAVKFVSRSIDIEMFDAAKLESYDASSKKSFSTPILRLIAELRKSLCDKMFWPQVSLNIKILKADYGTYMSRIDRLRNMLEVSEECKFLDTVKEHEGKLSQLDSFHLCFAYVHKIEGGYRSMKQINATHTRDRSSLAGKVVAAAELPFRIYKKYFGNFRLQSQHRERAVPFRIKPPVYNMKGYSAADLFVMADDATFRSKDIIDMCDATLEEGRRQNIEIDKLLRKMKNRNSSDEQAGIPFQQSSDIRESDFDEESEADVDDNERKIDSAENGESDGAVGHHVEIVDDEGIERCHEIDYGEEDIIVEEVS